MHSAYIGLAHGKGTVQIIAAPEGGYDVTHLATDGSVVATAAMDTIDGESRKDTKARGVAAVQMLMHWPSMLAEFAQDARRRSAIAGTLATPTAQPTTPGGLILPPGVSR